MKMVKLHIIITNWSQNNAYDFLEAPFRTLATKVQQGIETEEQLSVGFAKGISDAFKNFTEPFVQNQLHQKQ